MIPTYNADHFLEATLRSVLDQDPGPERMEIVVVDDRSPNGHAEAVVRRLGTDRVRFHAGATNVGLARNWNRCIEVSRGHWVHILHQDDLVLPGFYARLAEADAALPQPGIAFSSHGVIDGDGAELGGSLRFADQAGVLPGFARIIASMNHLQCPAIVVRRAVYERLGGYRPELSFVLDWEMWVRVCSQFPAWYEPERLALWRNHTGNESARLRRGDTIGPDIRKGIAIVRRYPLPLKSRLLAGRRLLFLVRDEELAVAQQALGAGDYRTGLAALRSACRYDRTYWFQSDLRKQVRQGLKLWLRARTGRRPPTQAPKV